MSILSIIDKLDEYLVVARGNAEKFEINNNKAAGTRVRKNMQDIKTLAQSIRNTIQNAKNASKGG